MIRLAAVEEIAEFCVRLYIKMSRYVTSEGTRANSPHQGVKMSCRMNSPSRTQPKRNSATFCPLCARIDKSCLGAHWCFLVYLIAVGSVLCSGPQRLLNPCLLLVVILRTRQPVWSRRLLYRWTWLIVRQVHDHSPRGSQRCRDPKSADKFVVKDIVQYALLRASYWTIFTALLSVDGWFSDTDAFEACVRLLRVMWCDVMRSRKLCSIFFEPDNRQSSTRHHQSNY